MTVVIKTPPPSPSWDMEQVRAAPTPLTQAQAAITLVCEEVKEMLLEKNRRYGNSALEPVRIFSVSDTQEQIRVRIDDKLSRIRSGQTDDVEDVVMDLIGYLILLRAAARLGA